MKIALTTLPLLLAANFLLAQNNSSANSLAPNMFHGNGSDISLLSRAFTNEAPIKIKDQFALSKQNTNELQAVLSGLFLVYKSFFSSQDNQQCSFHPSCSEFGLEAVKKLGVIKGVMCTCDRLTRCNGFSPDQYEIDLEKRKLKDPVKW